MPRYSRGFDTGDAFAHLLRRDRKLGAWIRRLGPIDPDPRWRKRFDPVDALARAILYQQLSGKAAATIVGRVETAIDSDRFHCDTLGRCDDATIRACGVSGNKLLALRDLALREVGGEIPDLRRMSNMDNDAIIEALVPIRGIGRWTVEMMLMSRLGRPDVLPIDDFGIRNGFRLAYGLRGMPTPRALAEFGARWAPFRSVAAWYLWRAVDLHRAGKLPAPATPTRIKVVKKKVAKKAAAKKRTRARKGLKSGQ
jgi:DNA-3-methyladenine glycosylase II